ncbi:hypothetical protein thalar_00749 [Litoreibacter arenae DSM 19593]|uniref:Uncharacterized protein n=1 Tax=Litoreibacter arenae DSM 19593 TaxID=1123360 RepID=S9S539_9RHOB|nr:hypothetical protein thalar_00749 [Litoreibacter arenae DSM 19593]
MRRPKRVNCITRQNLPLPRTPPAKAERFCITRKQGRNEVETAPSLGIDREAKSSG